MNRIGRKQSQTLEDKIVASSTALSEPDASHIRLSSIGKQGMDRNRLLRDRDGKKESLSESVDHTLGERGRPYYLESIQVFQEFSLGGDNGKREEWDLLLLSLLCIRKILVAV